MTSRKKPSEGIALLSMYNDDEEEDEVEDVKDASREEQGRDRQELTEEDDYRELRSAEEDAQMVDGDGMDVAGDSGNSYNTPQVVDDRLTPDKGRFGPSTPQQYRVSTASPMPQQRVVPVGNLRIRRGKVTIVDYGHDEVAMSPEPEEEEVEGNGRVVFGKYFQSANDDLRDKTPPGTIQVLPTSNQATSPLFDPSQTDNINYVVHDSESGDAEEAVVVDKTDVDPLDKFLPPPPKAKCSEELQRKINKFLEYKKARKSFNAEVRNRKDYRNPDFLRHAVRYQDINQIGSCFSKDVFNPHGYDNSDYCDEIEADMRREMHRKEQEKKRNKKVDFVSLGTQPGMVSTAPKINIPHPGVSTTAASMLNSISLTADAITRNGRSNKKSKWDKVDGDRMNPLPLRMQDSVSAVGTHATVISASNAGGGYLAFVQQRRREAEEKRSSERRLARRS